MSLQQKDYNAINIIIAAIQGDPAMAYNTSQLAKMAGMSPLYFRRLFKDVSGLTVQQFITQARMTRAAMLLSESDKTIKEIAFVLRYADLTSFYRSFSKFHGCTPLQYRRRNSA